MSIHRLLKVPKLAASTGSPGQSVLSRVASQAPVPLEGNTKTSPRSVWKTRFKSRSSGRLKSGNSEPRWSSIGRDSARRMRSGTCVGPGMKSA
jgi:hypothetical protein